MILPVFWLSFGAFSSANAIRLEWKTNQEQNNSHFVVEHSTNGQDFLPLAKITANNLPTLNTYTYTHTNFANAYNYYRIKQVDTNGTFSYSQLVAVNRSKGQANELLRLFPNPASQELYLTFANNSTESTEIELIDLLGITQKTYLLETLPTNLTLVLPVLSAGVYLLQITNKDFVAKQKVVIK